ncbi:MAG: HEAT repeat domain-containing protein [Smithellaceae bacterium]|jgi:HEAT repeat protein
MDIKQKSLDALILINTAIMNVRLYPPTSATIINTIERLHRAFLDMFALEAPIIFAESEKNLLICEKPLDQKDQERLQVTTLLNILIKFGIKSITFDIGLGKAELSAFLEILSKRPESVKNEGGLLKIMDEKNVRHIYLDQTVYVAMKKNQKIISSLDITDDQITQFFMQTHPELAGDPEKLQEMMKNPEWLSQAFQAGLSQLTEQKGALSDVVLSENLEKMIALMDKVAGSLDEKDRDKVSEHIGKFIASLDSDIVQQLNTQNIEHLFGGALMKYFVSEIAGDKHVKAHTLNEEEVSIKTQIPNLKETLLSLPKDDQKAFLDASSMLDLPKLFEQLYAQKEHETMELIISRLVRNLFSKNADVRAQASTALADIFAGLSHERQNNLVERLSAQLIDWIKIEPLATLAYEKICNNLKDLVHDFISQGRFAEAIPILDVFSNISAGILEKNDKAQEISSDIIRSLTSAEHLSILLKAFNTKNPAKQVESGKILVRLDDDAMNSLLDILRDRVDSDERVRIMKLFIGIGRRAVPVIRDRINKTAPWYYLRNLAYILGHIGNESSAEALKPLLLHENKRLRMEALNGIYRTGGKERGTILLSVLPLADDEFKLNIIEALGNVKSVEAVPELLDMLKSRRAVTPSLRADREEKICVALGSIGSPEALPALSKIAKSISFRIRPYAAKVKIAAGIAVASIRKKQEEAAQATKATEAAQEAKAAEALDEVKVSS